MISAVVPAHNEADRIGDTLAALAHISQIDEMVVVDDGSRDATASVAQQSGCKVVRLPRNQGKGAALARGIAESNGDVLILLDADLGATASQCSLLLQPLLEGTADLAIATFPVIPGKGGGVGLVVRLARWGIHRKTGRTMIAPLSGQRAIRREVFDQIGSLPTDFGIEVVMTIRALRAGFRVVETPTKMTHRVTGRDLISVIHRARQFIAVAKALLRA